VEYLLDGVTEEDLQNAISLVGRQDSFDLLKTYGPNKDTMLMALCCKKDDTPMIRAQVKNALECLKLRFSHLPKSSIGLCALWQNSVHA